LRSAGWLTGCDRRLGEGSMVWGTRTGVRCYAPAAKPIDKAPDPHTWPHLEACAWTAAWLTVRGREMIGPRGLLNDERWQGEVRWRERYEIRRRGHRPDLAGRLPDGRWMPVEVELSHKSRARLNAVLDLHADWIRKGHSPALIYICADQHLADRVHAAGTRAGLSIEYGTLRIEILESIKRETLEARGGTAAKDWG